jgi:uncharacterized spore protein YtfJ
MKILETISQARDAITVKRVFGDAYEKDGVTFIPAAWIAGGGGGGGDTEGNGGGGFGMAAFPVGAYLIKDGEVSWRPAVNVNVLVLAGLFTLRTLMRTRKKHR